VVSERSDGGKMVMVVKMVEAGDGGMVEAGDGGL